MTKNKFTAEFEINASQRMLFPYIASASGLSQWFADDVTIDEDKNYHIYWNGENHPAKIAALRTNSFVKFEFIPGKGDNPEDEHTSLEFKLEKNELTNSTYLKVIDNTEMEDEDELYDIWENMVTVLKETVGG